jgi:hypothetical protein
MTAHSIISVALISRNLPPIDGCCTCACCNDDTLFRSDMDVSSYPRHHNDAMKTRYLGPCCNGCTDAHVQCAGCDVAVPLEDAATDNDGDHWCEKCQTVSPAQQAAQSRDDNERAEREAGL